MNAIAAIFAFYLFARFCDRLRQMSWSTARPMYVAMYLAHVLWSLGIVYDVAFSNGMQWNQWFGLAAQFLWLEVTKSGWIEGVPPHIKTQPGRLGSPEMRRF